MLVRCARLSCNEIFVIDNGVDEIISIISEMQYLVPTRSTPGSKYWVWCVLLDKYTENLAGLDLV